MRIVASSERRAFIVVGVTVTVLNKNDTPEMILKQSQSLP